jgi:hypothetical protein
MTGILKLIRGWKEAVRIRSKTYKKINSEMMKLKTILIAVLAITLFSCKGKSKQEESSSKNPEKNTPALEDITFQRQNFEDMGTIELPAGPDWKKEGNKLVNEKLNMVIVVQSHSGDMAGIEKDYLDSYNDVNIRDAEGWKRGQEDLITLDGLSAARTQGSFNNGTPFVTRDYIFFDKNKVAIVQTRVVEKNKSKLAPVADYIAASFKK